MKPKTLQATQRSLLSMKDLSMALDRPEQLLKNSDGLLKNDILGSLSHANVLQEFIKEQMIKTIRLEHRLDQAMARTEHVRSTLGSGKLTFKEARELREELENSPEVSALKKHKERLILNKAELQTEYEKTLLLEEGYSPEDLLVVLLAHELQDPELLLALGLKPDFDIHRPENREAFFALRNDLASLRPNPESDEIERAFLRFSQRIGCASEGSSELLMQRIDTRLRHINATQKPVAERFDETQGRALETLRVQNDMLEKSLDQAMESGKKNTFNPKPSFGKGNKHELDEALQAKPSALHEQMIKPS